MSPWYAVARGHKPGVYETWTQCQEQTMKFAGAMFKKFESEEDALAFIAKHASDKITGKPSKKKADTASKPDNYYAVARGHKPGVYRTWAECQEQIFKFGGARYKKFESEEEALNFIAENKVGAAASKKKDSTSDLKRKRSAPDDDDDDEDDDDDDDDDEDEDEPKERSKVAKVSDDKPSKSKRSREDVFDETDAVVVYTDGACAGNGQKGAVGGIGVYWGIDSPHNVAEPLVGVQTNNRAEYTAVSTALRQAISLGHKKLILRTDSNLLINSMTKWIAGWKKKGWKTATGAAVKNRPELEEIDGLMQKIKVKFEHVRGHQGIFGNEEADRLAREGAKKGMIRK